MQEFPSESPICYVIFFYYNIYQKTNYCEYQNNTEVYIGLFLSNFPNILDCPLCVTKAIYPLPFFAGRWMEAGVSGSSCSSPYISCSVVLLMPVRMRSLYSEDKLVFVSLKIIYCMYLFYLWKSARKTKFANGNRINSNRLTHKSGC